MISTHFSLKNEILLSTFSLSRKKRVLIKKSVIRSGWAGAVIQEPLLSLDRGSIDGWTNRKHHASKSKILAFFCYPMKRKSTFFNFDRQVVQMIGYILNQNKMLSVNGEKERRIADGRTNRQTNGSSNRESGFLSFVHAYRNMYCHINYNHFELMFAS